MKEETTLGFHWIKGKYENGSIFNTCFGSRQPNAIREAGNFYGIKCYTLGYANVEKTGDKLNQIEQGIGKTSIDFLQKPEKMFPRAVEHVKQ
ncbi:hypothetical protein CFP56_029720 [Quercus suber]|uniref:Uncharacterized protein n=1 Tax=Quercus suber TaxID=58331 RepID=A0AAW0JQT4_QUESU